MEVDWFVGEIRSFAGDFAPQGWSFCDGRQLPITRNEALFSLIGDYYGGDGRSNFKLPDLRSRVPIGFDDKNEIGRTEGSENAVTAGNPGHTHSILQPVIALNYIIAINGIFPTRPW